MTQVQSSTAMKFIFMIRNMYYIIFTFHFVAYPGPEKRKECEFSLFLKVIQTLRLSDTSFITVSKRRAIQFDSDLL